MLIGIAFGFASCWLLLHVLHASRPVPTPRPAAPLVHYTLGEIGAQVYQTKLPRVKDALITQPDNLLHPVLPSTLPYPQGSSWDLIDTRAQPVIKLDQLK